MFKSKRMRYRLAQIRRTAYIAATAAAGVGFFLGACMLDSEGPVSNCINALTVVSLAWLLWAIYRFDHDRQG